MIDHLGVQVADLEASKGFYTTLLAPLGIGVTLDYGVAVGFGTPEKPFFWLSPAERGETRELHVAFRVNDRATVDAFHEAATTAGIEVLHAPRVFPEYHPDYYGCFVRDLDGHNVEAVCHYPPTR
jgi:catechol 2,3-dioxygenase-like lactoylglutathione lyase family enzyme